MEDYNKIAVVTGGAQGIGKCIFEEFKKLGYVVAVVDMQPQPTGVAPDLYYCGDLADKSVLDDFADTIITKFGHVDVLVNNATTRSFVTLKRWVWLLLSILQSASRTICHRVAVS